MRLGLIRTLGDFKTSALPANNRGQQYETTTRNSTKIDFRELRIDTKRYGQAAEY